MTQESTNYGPYLGKYRGTVLRNDDPEARGRIIASVEGILEHEETGWALPCSPYAGKNVGIFFVPPEKANVWIEFECGNFDHPIWSGCFWTKPEIDEMFSSLHILNNPDDRIKNSNQIKIIKTNTATIILDDLNPAVTIKTTRGLKIAMDANGIKISNSKSKKLEITDQSVSINGDALRVL